MPVLRNLKLLIEAHYKITKSLKAKEIFEDFEIYLPNCCLAKRPAIGPNPLGTACCIAKPVIRPVKTLELRIIEP